MTMFSQCKAIFPPDVWIQVAETRKGCWAVNLCWTFYRGATDVDARKKPPATMTKPLILRKIHTRELLQVWTSWFVTWLVDLKRCWWPDSIKRCFCCWKNLTNFCNSIYTIEIGTRHISDHIKLVGQYPCFHDVKQTMLSSVRLLTGHKDIWRSKNPTCRVTLSTTNTPWKFNINCPW